MAHVSDQIRDSLIERLKAIPTLDGRVFARGATGWDRRSYPMCVVNAGATAIATERSGYDEGERLQTRTQAFIVEIHDLDEGDEANEGRLSELAVAVEATVLRASSQTTALVDDITLTADTGVAEVQSDEDGLHLAQALSFSVRFHTVEGTADAFFRPN